MSDLSTIIVGGVDNKNSLHPLLCGRPVLTYVYWAVFCVFWRILWVLFLELRLCLLECHVWGVFFIQLTLIYSIVRFFVVATVLLCVCSVVLGWLCVVGGVFEECCLLVRVCFGFGFGRWSLVWCLDGCLLSFDDYVYVGVVMVELLSVGGCAGVGVCVCALNMCVVDVFWGEFRHGM